MDELKDMKCRRDNEEPSLHIPNIDNEAPNLNLLLRDRVDPKFPKSRTESEAPIRASP